MRVDAEKLYLLDVEAARQLMDDESVLTFTKIGGTTGALSSSSSTIATRLRPARDRSSVVCIHSVLLTPASARPHLTVGMTPSQWNVPEAPPEALAIRCDPETHRCPPMATARPSPLRAVKKASAECVCFSRTTFCV